MDLERKWSTCRRVFENEGLGGVLRLVLRNLPGIPALLARMFPESWKEWHELSYWKSRRDITKSVPNHYLRVYTELFGLDLGFYEGKRVLDIGCGPRGTLEWADMTLERVGLDPLAKEYLKLGADRQKMTYVTGLAEAMPFENGRFDVIASLNSLDHVDNVDQAISEIKRTLTSGGLVLLLTDVGHEPTPCEPQVLDWDVLDRFAAAGMEILDEKHFERHEDVYTSSFVAEPFDHANPVKRPGTLLAKLRKRAGRAT